MNPFIKALLQKNGSTRKRKSKSSKFLNDEEASKAIRQWNEELMEKYGGFQINADVINDNDQQIIVKFAPVTLQSKDPVTLTLWEDNDSSQYTHKLKLEIDWNEVDEFSNSSEEYEYIEENIPKPEKSSSEEVVGLNLSDYEIDTENTESRISNGYLRVDIPVQAKKEEMNKAWKID